VNKPTRNGADAATKCAFNFKIPDDPVAIIEMIRPMIVEGGGMVAGAGSNVTFSIPTVVGRFEGVCTVMETTTVNIAVLDKPDIISCKVIRDQLTKYITQAVVMYRDQTKAAQAANGETVNG
jgi:hypothetical protein